VSWQYLWLGWLWEAFTGVKYSKITVTKDNPVIGIQIDDDYGHFTWISCVEVLE